jgi:hypothetical protein
MKPKAQIAINPPPAATPGGSAPAGGGVVPK